ncbi:preprotein translocase subunit YajC [Vagococcus humatus]|uniref:Preprotein translocase subunit YajC n=1 Tax=Vagococcus humatus TaxID=1889241 RepID=A0A429Z662_9ENTE|nr:preprotein translocase subunit YajC [Vagococcus humatus]RST89185.1 preprotein translocase subunit YajC [Vagococcus humatus]
MWENILASSIVMIGFIVIIVLIYGIMSFNNIKKQKKYYEELQTGLKKGQLVFLSNGIYGKIHKINKETIDVEIQPTVIMTVSRSLVSKIVEGN